jgi:hypothetical protein
MNDLIFTQEQHQQLFDGWNIVGVSVRSNDSFYLLLREMQVEGEPTKPDIEYKTRCIGYFGFLPEGQKNFAHFDIEYFNRPCIAAHFNGATQVVVVKANGEAFARGSGQDGMEELDKETTLNIKRVKSLLGDTYAVGTHRDVYKRTGIAQWEDLRIGIPAPRSRDEWTRTGFNDISAFDNGDLYAVGGMGDVWRFSANEQHWKQCVFPSNTRLLNVVCCPDGNVYIGAEDRSIYQGKEDNWIKLFDGHGMTGYNDLAWHNHQLCASSDGGFYRLIDNEMVRSDAEPYMGHMDTRDGVLLIAAYEHVWLNDGERWKTLVKPYDYP